MVSSSIASSRPSQLDSLKELMPRSDRAKLMDLVKLRGVVEGSRRSNHNSVNSLKDYIFLGWMMSRTSISPAQEGHREILVVINGLDICTYIPSRSSYISTSSPLWAA